MAWTTPIYDRTNNDIIYARDNQNSLLNLKGAFNVYDINRINDNIAYLVDKLNDLSYNISIVEDTTIYDNTSLFTLQKMDIMKNNIVSIVDGFYTNNNPALYVGSPLLNITIINNIEKNLYITKDLIEKLETTQIYSGTFYSNEEVIR